MHVFWFKENYHPKILGVCSILIGIFYLFLFSNESLLKPDSLGYIEFSPMRSIGYPFFLKTIYFLCGSYKLLPFIQIFIFCFSAYLLSLSFLRMSHSFGQSACLLLALLLNIPFAKLSFSILTDSLALSFLMIALSLAIKAILSKGMKPYYVLCIVIGMAALVRPLFIILSILPIVFLFFRFSFTSLNTGFMKHFSLGVVIIGSFLFLGSAVQFARHGFFRTEAFLGYNLIGKALVSTTAPQKGAMFCTQQVASSVQEVLNKAPNLQIRYLLSEPYYDELRNLIATSPTPTTSIHEKDDLWKHTAFSYIKNDFRNYLKDVWMNYWSLWQLWDFYTPKERKEFDEYIRTYSPLPLLNTYREPEMRNTLNKKFGHPFIVWSVRSILGLCFILSITLPVFTLRRRFNKKHIPPHFLIGTLCSLTVQMGFISIACVQAGLGRYALSFWPCLCILLFSCLTFRTRVVYDK